MELDNTGQCAVTQEVSASEEQFYPAKINWQYLLSLDREDVDTEQTRVHNFYYKTMFIKKFGKISTVKIKRRN